jgi:mannosyltransferase OCH1-like enzyme
MTCEIVIPKMIFQTSRIDKPPNYVKEIIYRFSPGWEYQHFTDEDIMAFFDNFSDEEFPNLKSVFYSFHIGQHRADLFRYYYLYKCGGVFIDSDAMIYENIDHIVKNYDFFSVNSIYEPNSIFQGFIGATPYHPVIYKALKHVYEIDTRELINDYHVLCRKLYEIVLNEYQEIENQGKENKMKLYQEIYGTNTEAYIINDENKIILIHYYRTKIIPNNL